MLVTFRGVGSRDNAHSRKTRDQRNTERDAEVSVREVSADRERQTRQRPAIHTSEESPPPLSPAVRTRRHFQLTIPP